MAKPAVHTLDLNFQGKSQAIASYVFEHKDGIVLIESGPGSTVGNLKIALAQHGHKLEEITHVLLTHIHLDHAGAAGYLASVGAQILVHPVGAPHLLNPEKLLASAARIYGDQMDTLWGQFLPVPESRLTVVQDGQEIKIGELRFLPIDTPGHAEHHYAYLFDDICFSGDIGAVRIPGYRYLRLPMPPPELNLEKWKASISRLGKAGFKRIAPTHFGFFDDVDWHLKTIQKELDETERWLEKAMARNPEIDELKRGFVEWMETQAREKDLSPDTIEAYRLANPLGMSADGLMRYWKKYKTPQ